MKIIYIANIRMPTEKAHGIQIMKMCEAFATDLEVILLVPRRFNDIKEDPFTYYGVKRSFKITKLPCLDLVVLDKFFGNFVFWVETITFLITARIYLYFKKYQVLYTREELTNLFFKNVVLEIHIIPPKIKVISKILWKRAKRIVVLTRYIKDELIIAGIPDSRILVSPDAFDPADFDINLNKSDIRARINFPLDKKIILYTGSFYLYDWKGVDLLLEVSKDFNNGCLFVLIGGTKSEIEEINKKYGNTNILTLEKKPHQKIPYYLKSADILVLPNKRGNIVSEKYTSPLKLFEYMASKRPIIASDLPSIREILNESNSILVEPNNPEKLAEGIKKALQNEELSDRISAQAFQDVQKHTWKKRAKAIIEFIKNED